MVFSNSITTNGMDLTCIDIRDIQSLENMIYKNPYNIYCVMDEKVENQNSTVLIVVYVSKETDYVLLVDQSNQLNSTITLNGEAVTNAYYEYIDVGIIEQFPFAFYVRS